MISTSINPDGGTTVFASGPQPTDSRPSSWSYSGLPASLRAGPDRGGNRHRRPQLAPDHRRRPPRGLSGDRGRSPEGDAEPGPAGAGRHPVRTGLLQRAGLHGEPAILDQREAPACRRGDPAQHATVGRCPHDGRMVPRPGIPDRGHRQDAFQRPVSAWVRGSDRYRGVAARAPGSSPAGRRPSPAVAAVPGPRRGLAQRRAALDGTPRRVDAIGLLR